MNQQLPDFSKFTQPVTQYSQVFPVYQQILAPISVDQSKNLSSLTPLKVLHNQPQILVTQPPQLQQQPQQLHQQPLSQVSFQQKAQYDANQTHQQSSSKLKSNTDENFYSIRNNQNSGTKKGENNVRFYDDQQKQNTDQHYQGYLEEKQRFLSNPGVAGAFGSFQQVTSTSRSQQLELELERERNQTQLLSTINNQLQVYIKELEDKFKESLTNNLQNIPQENEEEDRLSSKDDDKNQFGKTSSSIYETKIKLLEMENSQLQKVCEQLRTQASDFYEKNVNKEKNSIKNLELEKSYLESNIKLEKMNNQELKAKLSMVQEEKQELILGLEEKINELELLRNEQEQRLNDEYEKKIIDLEEKANTLLDQNKKIMNINDNLLQEIEAFKNANDVMRQNHFNQTEEIKLFWKKQLEGQQSKYNEQALLQSIAFETTLAKNQSQIQQLQTQLANEQGITQKAKDDLNNYVLRFQDLEDKLNMMLIGNEQLMQVAELHQEEIKKWKNKYNQATETFNTEVEKMKQKIQDETQENYKNKLKDKIETIENEKHKLNLRIQDLEMEKIQFQQESYNFQQKMNELELKNLDYNQTKLDHSTSQQKITEMENKFNMNKQQLREAEQNLQKFDKNFQIIINENEKLSKALELRLSEVQIWQTKYNTLQDNLEQNIKKLSNELEDRFQMQCQQVKDENEELLSNYKQKLEQLQETIKQKDVEIKQLEMVLDQRDKEINQNLSEFHQLKQKSSQMETQLHQKVKEVEGLIHTIDNVKNAKEDLQQEKNLQGSAIKASAQKQQIINVQEPPKIIITSPQQQIISQQQPIIHQQVPVIIREQIPIPIQPVPIQHVPVQQVVNYANPTPIFTNYQQQSEFEIHKQNINLIQQENQMLREQQNLLKDQLTISKSQKNLQTTAQTIIPTVITTSPVAEIIQDQNLIIEHQILSQKYDELRHENIRLDTIIQNLQVQNQDYKNQIAHLQANVDASNLRTRDKDEITIHNVRLEQTVNEMQQEIFALEQIKKQLEETLFHTQIEKQKSEDQLIMIEHEKQQVITLLQTQNDELNLTLNDVTIKASHNDKALITQIQELQKENLYLQNKLSNHQTVLEEMDRTRHLNTISVPRYMSPPVQDGRGRLLETKKYITGTSFPYTSNFSIFQENDKLNQQILKRCQRIIQNQ